jgi:hypothetical protein
MPVDGVDGVVCACTPSAMAPAAATQMSRLIGNRIGVLLLDWFWRTDENRTGSAFAGESRPIGARAGCRLAPQLVPISSVGSKLILR